MNKDPQTSISTALLLYIENALAAARTTGALLLGNSALVYYEVIGRDPSRYTSVLFIGVSLCLLASTPVVAIRNCFKKE